MCPFLYVHSVGPWFRPFLAEGSASLYESVCVFVYVKAYGEMSATVPSESPYESVVDLCGPVRVLLAPRALSAQQQSQQNKLAAVVWRSKALWSSEMPRTGVGL